MINPKRAKKPILNKSLLKAVKLFFLFGFIVLFFTFFIGNQSGTADSAKENTQYRKAPVGKANVNEKVFGITETGKEIKGFEFGRGNNCILLFAAIHGNEKGTVELLDNLIAEIKAKPSIVSPSKKIVIIPMLNPDGYYDREDKLNANEVNLNLNFKTSDWQVFGPEGQFGGEEPFTEKESRILKEVVEKYKPESMISFHSQGAIVSPELYHSPSAALAKWYSEKTGYTYVDEASWDFPGTATKWFKETYDKAAITVELTNHLESDWGINKPVLLELIS